jgi:hypothetical protein
MCARWVLRDLSDEQKRNCAEVCQQSVTFFWTEPWLFVIINGLWYVWGKTFWLKLKQQSYVWKHKDFLPWKKFCTVPLSRKVCWYCFLTQKSLFFSTGYLENKLWMVFPLQITLKTHLRNTSRKKRLEF